MLSARDLPLLPVFVSVAQLGSFSEASRQLGLAKSVVSHHIKTLELRCGVRLIERSTRGLRLTQVGEQVLEAASEVLASVRSLERIVEGQRDVPTGTLRVTAPNDMRLASVLGSVAAGLLQQHSALTIDLVLDDELRDLVKEGLDVALRLGPLVDSNYVAHQLGSEPEIIVAGSGLVSARGSIEEPRSLTGAPWVAHSASRLKRVWSFTSESSGSSVQIAVDLRATANSTLALRALLVEGVGFGALPLHMVHDDLEAGRLHRVCPLWFRRHLSLHALLPTRESTPRVRHFLVALEKALVPLGFDRAQRRSRVD
jgi:DNA-binding transcriptional LysR family regulator